MKVHLRFGVEAPVGARGKEGAWKPMQGRYSAACRWSPTISRATSTCCIATATSIRSWCSTPKGNYLRSWGKGVIDDPHGIRVDAENHVWVVDGGAILKYTTDGKLLMTIGTKGVRGNDDKSFGSSTDLDWDSQGNIYIADG